MGGLLEAKCDCGFESGIIAVGGGMLNYAASDMEPALCIECHLFLVKNHVKKYSRCPKCRKKVIFYDDPRLRVHTGNSVKEKSEHPLRGWQWGSFTLPDTKYVCPKCGKMKMVFSETGCWD